MFRIVKCLTLLLLLLLVFTNSTLAEFDQEPDQELDIHLKHSQIPILPIKYLVEFDEGCTITGNQLKVKGEPFFYLSQDFSGRVPVHSISNNIAYASSRKYLFAISINDCIRVQSVGPKCDIIGAYLSRCNSDDSISNITTAAEKISGTVIHPVSNYDCLVVVSRAK